MKAGLAAADADLRSAAHAIIDDQTFFLHPKLDHALQRAWLNAQLAAELLHGHGPGRGLDFVKNGVEHKKISGFRLPEKEFAALENDERQNPAQRQLDGDAGPHPAEA